MGLTFRLETNFIFLKNRKMFSTRSKKLLKDCESRVWCKRLRERKSFKKLMIFSNSLKGKKTLKQSIAIK